MPELIWHPDALVDIAKLDDFLAPTIPAAARQAAKAILDAADKIASNSGIGTPHAEFRAWPAKFERSAYVLRYFILQTGDILVPASGIAASSASNGKYERINHNRTKD